jgi:hypothetical protein
MGLFVRRRRSSRGTARPGASAVAWWVICRAPRVYSARSDCNCQAFVRHRVAPISGGAVRISSRWKRLRRARKKAIPLAPEVSGRGRFGAKCEWANDFPVWRCQETKRTGAAASVKPHDRCLSNQGTWADTSPLCRRSNMPLTFTSRDGVSTQRKY